jgi:hypothetical protein
MIQFEQVSKIYAGGQKALMDVNFHLRQPLQVRFPLMGITLPMWAPNMCLIYAVILA